MTATFHVGDAIEVMGKLPEKSVDLILTSPPFLALRSYLPADHPDKALEGGSQATPGEYIDWLIDVVEACDRVLAPHGSMCIELGDTYAGSGGAGGDYADGLHTGQPKYQGSQARGRTLRPGDPSWRDLAGYYEAGYSGSKGGSGWPLPKSLSLIPELFRLTLVYGTNPLTGRTTERWRLRNVVRWVRPNPPVGALGDKFRPATSELMVFCKSAKRYFDLDAVRTVNNPERVGELGGGLKRESARMDVGLSSGSNMEKGIAWNPTGAPPLDWWNIPLLEGEEPVKGGPKVRDRSQELPMRSPKFPRNPNPNTGWAKSEEETHGVRNPLGAPPLDWWEIPPGGYQGSHYAVFPPELCIKPIKAMCPEKVCKVCGEPSRRIVADVVKTFADGNGRHTPTPGQPTRQTIRTTSENLTLGWTDCGHGPDCVLPTYEDRTVLVALDTWATERMMVDPGQCDESHWRPGLVLDPFGGSGTTALVATGHGRDCILIDLDERNFDLALQRVGPFILERAG